MSTSALRKRGNVKTVLRSIQIVFVAVGLLACFTEDVYSQNAMSAIAHTASPELIGQLTKSLNVTPAQASGGAGALFGLAKTKLSPVDFGKVASCVPGIDGLIKSAPAASSSKGIPGIPGLSNLGSALPGSVGGLASVAGSFQKLGLSPGMAGKFVPVLTSFVQAKGGSGVASLLSGALK